MERRISYADLNLASASDERRLKRRVGSAVTGLCREATDTPSTAASFNYSMVKCRTEAMGQARPQIALAVRRAHDIAATGSSNVAAVAIAFSITK